MGLVLSEDELKGGYADRDNLSSGMPAEGSEAGTVQSKKKEGLLSRIKKFDQSVKDRNAQKDERNALVKAAREKGRREGLMRGAEERGREEGLRQGRGEGGLLGLLKGQKKYVRSTTTTGKGKNRRTTTTYREEKRSPRKFDDSLWNQDLMGGTGKGGGGPSALERDLMGSGAGKKKRRDDDPFGL